MKKVALILVLLAIGVGVVVAKTNSAATPTATTQLVTKSFTLDEVTPHNSPSNCWMAIAGNVYDVSRYTSSGMHPGGERILQGCGKDATELFATQGGRGGHSSRATALLASFLIGTLGK